MDRVLGRSLIWFSGGVLIFLVLPIVAMEIVAPLTDIELCADYGGRWNSINTNASALARN
jgi:hypothetical protein